MRRHGNRHVCCFGSEVARSRYVLLSIFCLITAVFACAQTGDADFLNQLGLARLKDYSSARTSSGNSFVYSNDDSKRIMPGETLEIANLSGPGMVSHIWV